jgi:hypothetical protein
MIPVMIPAVGGIPEAMEIPMQSGKATRKTTMEAKRSRPKVAEKPALGSFVEIKFMRGPPTESALFEQA